MLAAPRTSRLTDWRLISTIVASWVAVTAGEAASQNILVPADTSGPSGLPLHPTRVARFQVSEGTWLSLDVSPDGRNIVFDLLGDLYILPITGGKARRITSGMAFNRQPRYSPDGRHLVFVSDHSGSDNVWIADLDGRNARQLSRLRGHPYGAVASPSWSPDGRSIVVSQMLGATRTGPVAPTQLLRWLLATYDVQTGVMRWVSDTAADRARGALGAAFTPDGTAIYAAIDVFAAELEPNPSHWRLARIEVATSRVVPEMDARVGRNGMRPAVSQDGHYLIYASTSGSRVGLRVRDLRTDEERWLVREALDNPPFDPYADSRDLVPAYAFMPDSKSLIAAYGGKIHRIDIDTGRAVVVPFVADVERGLGPLTAHRFALSDSGVRTRSVMHAALSPDGKWAAFSALDRIWLLKLPHSSQPVGRPWRLTGDSVGEFYPSWSPDGRWIAYSTWSDAAGGALRRADVRLDSESPSRSKRLTAKAALYLNTAVAPDGKRVVAVCSTSPKERVLSGSASSDAVLVWVPASGGHVRTISKLAAQRDAFSRLQYPAEQIYFTDKPDRIHAGLTSWRWDGTDRRIAVNVTGLEDFLGTYDVTGVLSMDGRRAIISRRSTLFEVSLPVEATTGTDVDLRLAQGRPLNASAGAAKRWGTAIDPWITWSLDGRRVIFSQGGTLFLGDVDPSSWTTFMRFDVPLVIPVDTGGGTLVLRGARLITMNGREVIDTGDLVVRNSRIVAVGRTGRVAIPPGARVFNVSGMTIVPGFVDVHDHLVLPKGVHPQQCWQCLVRLAYGVTASRDPQPGVVEVFAYMERERTGDLIGPRLFSSGPPVWRTDPPIRALDDARDAVRPAAQYFRSETFKIHYDPGAGRRTRQLLAMALAEKGLKGTVHGQGLALDLTVVLDGFPGLEHTPPVPVYDDVIALIAKSGTMHTQTYAPFFGAMYYMFRRYGEPWSVSKLRRFIAPSARAEVCSFCTTFGPPEKDDLLRLVSAPARIIAKGGKVSIGSHGNLPGLGFHYEMWLHAAGGMSNHDILRSATIVGAAAIGHAGDLGSLQAGKLADLLLLDANPLSNIHNTLGIRYVMKNGRLYRPDDLSELWPRRRALDRAYLWQ